MRRILAGLFAALALVATVAAGSASADTPGMTHNALGMTHN